jgi:PAS domain S-box-containing protein
MPEPHRTRHAAYIERYLRTGEAHILGYGREVGAVRSDGTVFPAELAIGELRTGGEQFFVGFVRDLTARKRAEIELIDARERAQNYLDLAEVILLGLDRELRITMINRKGREILGWGEGGLLGLEWVRTCVPDGDEAMVRGSLDVLMRGASAETRLDNEYSIVTSDGQVRLIAWHHRLVRDGDGRVSGVLSSGEDVTDRRTVERALQRSERLLRAAERVAGVGDFEVRIPGAGSDRLSPVVRQILGLDEIADFPADSFTGSVHADDRERFVNAIANMAGRDGTLDLAYRVVRPNGDVRFVHAIARARPEPGSAVTLVGMLHDVTERQRAEEELQRTRERLVHVGRLSTMGEMAAGLAHEINQPLAAISIYARACMRLLESSSGSMQDELREALEQIGSQALRAGDVIRRLRAMVQDRTRERTTIDCNRLVSDLIPLAEPDARSNDIDVRVQYAATSVPVRVDVVQIQQVLLNLIRNAIDAIIVAEGPRRIGIRVSITDRDEAEVSVTDTGCGLPEQPNERLFEPFFTTKPAGTGLGLSISRTIVHDHEGRLTCAPNPDGGAVFAFTLPLHREDGE